MGSRDAGATQDSGHQLARVSKAGTAGMKTDQFLMAAVRDSGQRHCGRRACGAGHRGVGGRAAPAIEMSGTQDRGAPELWLSGKTAAIKRVKPINS